VIERRNSSTALDEITRSTAVYQGKRVATLTAAFKAGIAAG
jgi:hypothetical protein